MFGREMEHMLVTRIGQKGTSFGAGAQVSFAAGHTVQPSEEFADIQAPVGVQVVEDPMKTLLVGKAEGNMSQMGSEVDTGTGHAQIPHDLAGRNDERGHQRASTMTDVFMLAFLRFAGLGRYRGVFPLENLHAGFFVTADDQLAVLI